jgi:N-methylhydantoinase B
LADIAPDRVRAGSYQMVSTYVMSTRANSANAYVLAEPVQGGHGAFPGSDGANMMFTGNGDASNTPIEVLEMRYPVVCEQFSLNEESAGAGQFRGGMGVRHDLRVLQEHSMIKTAQENSVDPLSRGARGGLNGAPSYVELRYPGQPIERQDERMGDTPVPVGFVLATRTGGGGGFGHPSTRDPARVAIDVRDDYVTPEQARDIYRVQVVPGELPGTWTVDQEQTSILRQLQKQV